MTTSAGVVFETENALVPVEKVVVPAEVLEKANTEVDWGVVGVVGVVGIVGIVGIVGVVGVVHDISVRDIRLLM
jgi:hypothetical protein